MPTYCYVTDDGEVHEAVRTIAERNHVLRLPDGREAKRSVGTELSVKTNSDSAWPLYSHAAGVLPNQIDRASAYAKKCGVPTDFDASGRAIFTSPSHRRRYLKIRGLHDEEGYD